MSAHHAMLLGSELAASAEPQMACPAMAGAGAVEPASSRAVPAPASRERAEVPHRYSSSYSRNYGEGCWGCAVAQGRPSAATAEDWGTVRCTTTRPPRRSRRGVRVVVQLQVPMAGVAAGGHLKPTIQQFKTTGSGSRSVKVGDSRVKTGGGAAVSVGVWGGTGRSKR